MAQALGVVFYDHQGKRMPSPMTGGMLKDIARIDTTMLIPTLKGIRITVACDVINPLTGPNGASCIYGPQKGADYNQVQQLDDGLKHLARLWREQLDKDVEQVPGAGAAGGLGGGLMAFCDAKLRSGLDIVLERVRFDERVRDCDLCLTGEGQLDGQSLAGKAVLGVAKAAAKHDVPTVAMVGRLGPGYEKAVAAGLQDCIEISHGLTTQDSITRARELLKCAASHTVKRYV